MVLFSPSQVIFNLACLLPAKRADYSIMVVRDGVTEARRRLRKTIRSLVFRAGALAFRTGFMDPRLIFTGARTESEPKLRTGRGVRK